MYDMRQRFVLLPSTRTARLFSLLEGSVSKARILCWTQAAEGESANGCHFAEQRSFEVATIHGVPAPKTAQNM